MRTKSGVIYRRILLMSIASRVYHLKLINKTNSFSDQYLRVNVMAPIISLTRYKRAQVSRLIHACNVCQSAISDEY